MSKLRCHFTVYPIDSASNLLFIADDDTGISITNDAEAVCEHCHKIYPGRRIIYRDTDGRWDELMHTLGEFNGYAPYKGEHP